MNYLLCQNNLNIGMTKFKSSASSIVVPSIFVIHIMKGAQFLNATSAPLSPVIVISPVTKM